MNKIYNICLIIILLSATSCNDWLDVRPETEVKKEDMLANYKGVRDALTGSYIELASRSTYGEKLTMTNIESLANLWYVHPYGNLGHKYLSSHDYDKVESRDIIKSIYSGLYNVVAQANLIIESLEANGKIISNPDLRDILLGEAYAIRAFCHLDILRLFGQVPQGTISVELPYSLKASIDEFPSYYDFDNYVALLRKDFAVAETLLKDKDPLFQYTFKQLNQSEFIKKLDDTYLGYRQFRFNYWAVKGLQARMALYIGQTQEAYQIAESIIGAQGPDGNPVISLSGNTDLINRKYACPDECLLALSKFDIKKYADELLFGSLSNTTVEERSNYFITETMLNQLFKGRLLTANNRYLYLWNKTAKNNQGVVYPTSNKYYYNEDREVDLMTKHQLIPLLRMSEIYLIAIETAPSLKQSNKLFKTYMASHSEIVKDEEFASDMELRNGLIDAYRIEFFGEGQMFYTYKRAKVSKILWDAGNMLESDYIIPLPAGEIKPNTKK